MSAKFFFYLKFTFRRAADNTDPINRKSNSSSISSSFSKRKFSELPKRESSMSLCSSTSIESDWSDEELEEVNLIRFSRQLSIMTIYIHSL